MDTTRNTGPQMTEESGMSQGVTNVLNMDTAPNTAPQSRPELAVSQGGCSVLDMDMTRNTAPLKTKESAMSQGVTNVLIMDTDNNEATQTISESAMSQGASNVLEMDITTNDPEPLSQGVTNVGDMNTTRNTVPQMTENSAVSQGGSNVLSMDTNSKCPNAICIDFLDVEALDDMGLRTHIQQLGRFESKIAGMRAKALNELERRSSAKEAAQMASEDLLSSRRDAQQAIKTAKDLLNVPDVLDALSQGKIPVKHAELIGRIASEGPIVEGELLEAATKEPFDRFNKTAKSHQQKYSKDDGQALLDKRRKRRSARFWENGQSGMYNLWAEFDPITGVRIATELTAKDQQLWRNEDPKNRRSPTQRMADALAELLCGHVPFPSPSSPANELDDQLEGVDEGGANDEGAGGAGVSVGEDNDGAEVDRGVVNGGVRGENELDGKEELGCDSVDGDSVEGDSVKGDSVEKVKCGCSQRSRRQGTNLLVIADYDLVNDRIVNGRLADGSSVPAEELVRLALEAKILPSIFNAKGEPLWLARRRRVASEVQRIALTVRDKGCINCDTSPLWCRAHHVEYWKNGGKTDIDNLVLVCNECHHKIHDEGWLVKHNHETGKYYLEKPNERNPARGQTERARRQVEVEGCGAEVEGRETKRVGRGKWSRN